jgi:ubiquinone/menaquinone biosynthesis C-methylase UbiE
VDGATAGLGAAAAGRSAKVIDDMGDHATTHRADPPSAESGSNAIHDQIADTYGYAVDESLSAQLKYQLVLRHAPVGARVLDVGCANGLHLRKIAPHCRAIVGIDINARMLELARATLAADGIGNAEVAQMSATELTFADATFDAAYSFSTLLLITELEQAVAEMARVLRPGGIAVLDITGRWNLSQRHWDAWGRAQGHPGLRPLTWPQTTNLLASVGLEVVEAPALGFLHQWRYVPVLRRATFLDKVIHFSPQRDLDYLVSNLRPLRPLANRWYVVCRRRA